MDLDQFNDLLRLGNDLFVQARERLAQLPPPDEMYQSIQNLVHQVSDTVRPVNDALDRIRR
jgi:hypothetical protein